MMKQDLPCSLPTGVTVLLASASPRRRELLAGMGIPFTVRVSEADESVPAGTPPRTAVELVARRKAEAVAATAEEGVVVIAADTTVDRDGVSLGKPRDAEDAVVTLLSLAGREHLVHTGVAVAYRGKIRTAAETTSVLFRPFDRAEAEAYVASGEPMDKAGSYGIQGLGGALVLRICGEFDNVVGLPCRLLSRLLEETVR